MQLGGIGGNHSADVHHVTKCLHSDEHSLEGKMKLTSPGLSAQQVMRVQREQQTQFSLTDWLQQLLKSVKDGMLGLWRGNEFSADGKSGEKTGSSQAAAQINDAGTAGAPRQEMALTNNPYFAAVTPDKPQSVSIPILQKAKLKAKAVAGQLTRHLPGRFFQFQKQGSFHAKREGTHEDLRKRSKYREDELEIDCVLTDESYLLDSYDRKGEYSQLTTKK